LNTTPVSSIDLTSSGSKLFCIVSDATSIGSASAITSFNNEYYPTSIIEIINANQKAKQHPTEKPLKLLRRLLLIHSNKLWNRCVGSSSEIRPLFGCFRTSS
jgi:hypothetical protein